MALYGSLLENKNLEKCLGNVWETEKKTFQISHDENFRASNFMT